MIKKLGYVLITVGFLSGAYFAVVKPEGLDLTPFIVSLVVGVAGIVAVRTARKAEASHEETLAANLGTLEESLRAVVTKIEDLDARKHEIDVYDLRLHIDKEIPAHLVAFVEARESVAHRYGLQSYADLMNPFAAGERYVNRVWSASTDGYIDEAHQYLGMAREQFEEALAVLERLRRMPAA